MSNHFKFEHPDYVQYVQQLADSFKVKAAANLLVLPPAVGNGFIWAETLPIGISVMAAQMVMVHEITLSQSPAAEHCYSLQFTEYSKDPSEVKLPGSKKNQPVTQLQSSVRLMHTLMPQTYVFPEGVLTQTVCFYFSKNQLNQLVGTNAVEEMLTKYFPYLLLNEALEPIATDYRITLNELQVETIDIPLRLNYIQNRVLLLLEKFIINLFNRKEVVTGKLKRTDGETMRLMQVEALLVKNFTLAPPTIDELSRISAMSPTKLKNDFKNLYGHPIYVYFQKNRMLKAKSMLLTGKYSIKEVGVMVGYSNLSHFANTFKREFSILPSEVMAKDGVLVYNS